jgi:NADPH:quinone reductase-like Zn-dependent oxidoreductase
MASMQLAHLPLVVHAGQGGCMKALHYRSYGDITRLSLGELPEPRPSGGPLVSVEVAALNPKDSLFRKGKFALLSGRSFPKQCGLDFAGTVTRAGGGMREGDRVFGALNEWTFRRGTLAEFVAPRAHEVALLPSGVDPAHAASVALVGLTALQALRDVARVKPGQRVLINGASGGVGTVAIQLARLLGAEVTTVSSAKTTSMCRALGAQETLDYAAFARGGANTRMTRGEQRDVVGKDGVHAGRAGDGGVSTTGTSAGRGGDVASKEALRRGEGAEQRSGVSTTGTSVGRGGDVPGRGDDERHGVASEEGAHAGRGDGAARRDGNPDAGRDHPLVGRFDVVFDVFGNLRFADARKLLQERGVFISTVPSARRLVREVLTRLSKQQERLVVVQPRRRDLEQLGAWLADGSLRAVIDGRFPLTEFASAFAKLESKHTHGKLIIDVAHRLLPEEA